MEIKNFTKFLTLLLILLVFLSATRAQASIVWTEDFEAETLTDWDAYGWVMSSDVHTTPIDSGFSVIDGMLRAPNYADYGKKSHINHDSATAYGTWSFDWLVSSPAHVGIEFMLTDLRTNFNLTGLHQNQVNFTGYAVLLVSFSASPGLGLQAPGINLLKFVNRNNYSLVTVLDTHKFAAEVVGPHHIEISRTLQGQFTVYYDSEVTLQGFDNITTTSEKFGITSWRGDSGIDNITISDTFIAPPTTTTTTTSPTTTTTTTATADGFVLWLLIPSFGILIVLRKKGKN